MQVRSLGTGAGRVAGVGDDLTALDVLADVDRRPGVQVPEEREVAVSKVDHEVMRRRAIGAIDGEDDTIADRDDRRAAGRGEVDAEVKPLPLAIEIGPVAISPDRIAIPLRDIPG